MINIVIFGPPGSGKGTQSDKITDRYGLFHISTGDVLRKHIKDGTDLGKTAEDYISKGQLIPDQLMIDILDAHLEANPESKKGVIFDGFPRTIPQAEALNGLLEKRGTAIDAVVGLEVDDAELMDRLVKRGESSGRSDDNPETIRKRLDVYHSSTKPLKDYYTKTGHYRSIKGMGGIDEVFEEICSHLDPLSEAKK
ncbi:MAG: adenylate kinase [Muribaculaceae bacterium]|nr:adenylate kinase [Muribaculaceae bacterium]